MLLTVIIGLLLATCKVALCLDSRGHNISGVSSNTTYVSAAYYVNWAIYDRDFDPQDLPVDKLTHVLYAFAGISTTGEVSLSDAWADTEKHFAGDSWNETGTNLYGCFKQFYLLKKAHRHLKVLLSIGGSSYSANFSALASTDGGRSRFASTAVSLVADLGLDGLDIDWEFPEDDAEAADMVLLLRSIRAALDAYGNSLSTPYRFQLTVACPTGPSMYQILHLTEMNQYIDFWFLMAYNYAGSWSNKTANQANLFPSISDPVSTPFNTAESVNYYITQGVPASKIVLGMPLYGHSFAATNGLGEPFNGVGSGTWEAGLYDFKALPLRGAIEFYDSATGSSYGYDVTSKQLVSYDNVAVARQKAAFVQQMRLGGAMWWESSADKLGNDSLIHNVVAVLGGINGSGLENSINLLMYPDSIYDNIRAGMPSFASTTTSSTTSEAASTQSKDVRGTNCSSGSSPTSASAKEVDSSPSSSVMPTQFTTSTIPTTSTSTIITCASSVNNCPPHSTMLTTVTIDLSTTICPVTETRNLSIYALTSSASSQLFSKASEVIQTTTNLSFDTASSSLTEIPCSEIGSTGTTTTAVTSLSTVPTIQEFSTITTTTIVPNPTAPLFTVTSVVIVSKRDEVCWASTSIILTTSFSLTTSSSFITSSSLSTSPSLAASSSLSTSSSLTASSSTLSVSSFTSSLSSSASITSSSTSEASGSGCQNGETCLSYNLLTCPGGTCFCGLDANNDPTCFMKYTCLRSCTTNDDCGAGEACLTKSCCPPKKDSCNLKNFQGCHIYTGGSTCAPLAPECPNS